MSPRALELACGSEPRQILHVTDAGGSSPFQLSHRRPAASGNFLPEANALIYSPTADGQKFLILANVGTVTPSVRLILNSGQTRN